MAIGKSVVVIFLSWFLLAPAATPVRSETVENPRIMQVSLHLENGQISSNITTTGLFPERIIGTIQSGLPAVVELFYHLMESNKSTVKKGVYSYSLNYDVWDDIYSISREDSTEYYPTFKAMRGMIERLQGIALIPVDKISPDGSYFIRMCVSVSPIQGTDKRKITGWIRENVRSDDRWHEQVLNINELITHFFAKEKDSANRSEWFQTETFKPGLLPGSNKEDK